MLLSNVGQGRDAQDDTGVNTAQHFMLQIGAHD
jgi:hypothetical protein